ncbi:MAG: MBL fold metallo-hydrolase [Candidatus Portnoybacteria bacterium CG10_big_fil_rev_8_21_14_0_10_36_7]|uniref:MBL fold metallo-hydrolase n=1 Tax=Candidatus Portnoybacteria bacterium CG10_big_fil_rev_8_21_14_0_10_36_7 TaxID=1974812 RepID=A0A2M8KDK0_9BACT|nr:MAG: MBL fold metallo-hydrolase [Candidatus Portnoybacteria bacterium CG10_big_fil_rev_8_21_14_0_10_36_7]
MVITWYGHSCFKIQSGQLTLLIDPFDSSIGLRSPRGKTDIVFVTHKHYDHNYLESVDQDTFVIDGPGEYEVKGVACRGISSFHDASEGKDRGLNTIYLFEMEGIKVCHLGDLGHKLANGQLEALEEVDILFVPVGGKYTLDGEEAAEVVYQIEPKIIIPMHYKVPGLKISLGDATDFLKEMGVSGKEATPKITIKKKELPENGTVMVMSVGSA